MSKTTVRHIEPFTNDFGDVIQPGEAVYSITMCTKTTSVKKGEYLGVIKRVGWRGKEELSVQVLVDANQTKCRFKDTGQDTTWTNWYYNERQSGREIEYYTIPYKRVSTLQRNRIVPARISADQLASVI